MQEPPIGHRYTPPETEEERRAKLEQLSAEPVYLHDIAAPTPTGFVSTEAELRELRAELARVKADLDEALLRAATPAGEYVIPTRDEDTVLTVSTARGLDIYITNHEDLLFASLDATGEARLLAILQYRVRERGQS